MYKMLMNYILRSVCIWTLSYFHHQIGNIDHKPSFRFGPWNIGACCISSYVLLSLWYVWTHTEPILNPYVFVCFQITLSHIESCKMPSKSLTPYVFRSLYYLPMSLVAIKYMLLQRWQNYWVWNDFCQNLLNGIYINLYIDYSMALSPSCKNRPRYKCRNPRVWRWSWFSPDKILMTHFVAVTDIS